MSRDKSKDSVADNISKLLTIATKLKENNTRAHLRVIRAINENIDIEDRENNGLIRDIKLYHFYITGEKLDNIRGLNLNELLPQMQKELEKNGKFAHGLFEILKEDDNAIDKLYPKVVQVVNSYTQNYLDDMMGQRETGPINWVPLPITFTSELINDTATKIFNEYQKNGFQQDYFDGFINDLSAEMNLDIIFASNIKEDGRVEYKVEKNGKTTIIDLQKDIDNMVQELESAKKRGEQYLGFFVIVDFLRDLLSRFGIDPSIKQSHLNKAENYLNKITTEILNPSASSPNQVRGSV